MRQNTESSKVKGIRLLMRCVKSVFRGIARAFSRIVCTMACIAIGVYLAHTFVPGLIQDMLGFKQVSEINDTVLREELTAISELATYEFAYSHHVDNTSPAQLLGHNVWLSDHRFAFDYHGVIKAGYTDLEKIEVLWIDSAERTVGIWIPEAAILSNEIFIDMATYEDQNNLCNPLEPREVLEYLYAQKDPELAKALDQGLLAKAGENARRLITLAVESLGYTAVYR